MVRKLQGGMTLGRSPILSGATNPVLAHLALKGELGSPRTIRRKPSGAPRMADLVPG
jgi:hypothetical protein